MAEFKLSLVQRKNLKENDEKLNESLQKIRDATGVNEWAMEIDWGTVYPVYQLGDRPGDTIYGECMSALAGNIENLCKIEATKEAFNSSLNQSKIIFNVDKKASSYWSEKIVNGCLEIGYKGSVCNVYELGRKIEDQLTTTFEECEMPIKLRTNIESEDVQEKKNNQMEKIKEATGRDFELKVQWAEMIKDHMDANYPQNFGESILNSVLEGLADNVKKLCSTEYGKDAFNEFATTGVIIINSNKNDKKASSYFTEAFVNGDVVISFKSICNCYEIGRKFENLLTCTFEDVVIPLRLRLNIADTEEKKEEHMQKINDATGRDFTLKVEWAEMIKDHMDANYPQNFGGSILDSVLEGLSSNIRSLCNDEHFPGKDAFNEFATTGNIIINSNKNDKKATSYFTVKFENGDLVISFKSICNCYEIGRNIPELLTVVYEDVTIPYLTRKSLAQYEEKREENMQTINTATGRTFELAVDWAKLIPFMLKDNRPDYVGSTLYESVLSGLADNLKKLCADEMSQEAFNEVASTGKIIFSTQDDKKASGYFTEKFENGDVVILFKSICNCYEIGRGFEKLL
jgi:hypothetical protein